MSQFSDDEISARYLIVDLQSQTDDNYLLAKTTCELQLTTERGDKMKLEIDELKSQVDLLQKKINDKRKELDEKQNEVKEKEGNNLLKIQYLKKSLVDLCNQFSSMTPVYLIADFVKDYSAVPEMKKNCEMERLKLKESPELSMDLIVSQLKETLIPRTDIEARIEIIKQKSSCDYLKQQLEMQEMTIKDLHNEVAKAKMTEKKK